MSVVRRSAALIALLGMPVRSLHAARLVSLVVSPRVGADRVAWLWMDDCVVVGVDVDGKPAPAQWSPSAASIIRGSTCRRGTFSAYAAVNRANATLVGLSATRWRSGVGCWYLCTSPPYWTFSTVVWSHTLTVRGVPLPASTSYRVLPSTSTANWLFILDPPSRLDLSPQLRPILPLFFLSLSVVTRRPLCVSSSSSPPADTVRTSSTGSLHVFSPTGSLSPPWFSLHATTHLPARSVRRRGRGSLHLASLPEPKLARLRPLTTYRPSVRAPWSSLDEIVAPFKNPRDSTSSPTLSFAFPPVSTLPLVSNDRKTLASSTRLLHEAVTIHHP